MTVLIKGKIIAYEMPSFAHASVEGVLIRLIGNWSNHLEALSNIALIIILGILKSFSIQVSATWN